MLKDQEVTVVGAGIGGMAAALALARRGARVRVLEQAPELGEVGAGLQISPNGVRVLDALGLGEASRRAAIRSHGVWLRDGLSGRGVLELDFRRLRPDAPFLLFHRADLLALLVDAARAAGVDIATGVTVERVLPLAGHVEYALAGGTQGQAAFLVGADGLHSVIRPVLNGAQAPFFTGQVAWRALVPSTGREEPEATVYMGPRAHIVAYPLRQGQIINVVAVEERRKWVAEGWTHAGDPDELRKVFAGFSAEARALLARVEQVHIWGLFRHPVAATWHGQRLVILGDAAHPTLPFMAQGAVMALEDAWVLAECLDRLGFEQGPAAYQAARQTRARRIVEAANRNARNYHHANPAARALGHGALRLAGQLAPGAVLNRFAWIYDFDVTA